MSNMTLEALLVEFEPWGIFSLAYKWNAWHAELNIPGYLGQNLRSYVTGKGKTPGEAAEACWSELEEWQASGRMAEDRARALAQWQLHENIWSKASSYERNHGHNPTRRPPPLEPERPLKS